MAREISILMIEDSSIDTGPMLEQLEAGGYRCSLRRVDTREDLLAALDEECPDIFLSDFSLPSFDGMSALEEVQKRCPEIPFIFVSGVMGEEIVIEALKKGATDFLVKQRLHRLGPAVTRALAEAQEKTERKRAESALRRSEERLRLALHTAGLGAWELHSIADRIECSPICRVIAGIPPDAAFDYTALLAAVHPDYRDEVHQKIQAAWTSDQHFETEYRVIWPDASIHWVVASGSSCPDSEDGKPRMVGVMLDITARKEVEASLARQAGRLALLNADLQQLAYAASHDLQEPLRMISTFTQLFVKRYRNQLDANADEFLQYIETGTKRMAHLLEDLLTYTRTNTISRQTQTADMGAVLQQSLMMLRVAIQESQAKITHDIPLPVLSADSSQMVQVLQNLIGNALKYRGSDSPHIHIGSRRDGDSWVFSVRDNGIGFEQEYAEQVFGLFKRLHPRDYPGTGLGLAICKRIVEQHGGKVWAESQTGNGSTFYFSLPLNRYETRATQTPVDSVNAI